MCSGRWWPTWPVVGCKCVRCSFLSATLTLAGIHVEERDTWISSALLSLLMVRTFIWWLTYIRNIVFSICSIASHRRERGGECQCCGAFTYPSSGVLWPSPERRGRERPPGCHGGGHQDLRGSRSRWTHRQKGQALHVSEVNRPDIPSNTIAMSFFYAGRFGGEEQQEENRVHLGNAIMSFYSALIDLLGRCAPEMHVHKAMLFR